MPGNSAATRLNRSCQTWCAGTAFALSLIVTRVLPCACAHWKAARIMRSTPFVVVSGVGKPLEVESKPMLRRRPLEHRDRGFDDLGADPVPGDHRDLVPLHSKPVARPQLTQ